MPQGKSEPSSRLNVGELSAQKGRYATKYPICAAIYPRYVATEFSAKKGGKYPRYAARYAARYERYAAREQIPNI